MRMADRVLQDMMKTVPWRTATATRTSRYYSGIADYLEKEHSMHKHRHSNIEIWDSAIETRLDIWTGCDRDEGQASNSVAGYSKDEHSMHKQVRDISCYLLMKGGGSRWWAILFNPEVIFEDQKTTTTLIFSWCYKIYLVDVADSRVGYLLTRFARFDISLLAVLLYQQHFSPCPTADIQIPATTIYFDNNGIAALQTRPIVQII